MVPCSRNVLNLERYDATNQRHYRGVGAIISGSIGVVDNFDFGTVPVPKSCPSQGRLVSNFRSRSYFSRSDLMRSRAVGAGAISVACANAKTGWSAPRSANKISDVGLFIPQPSRFATATGLSFMRRIQDTELSMG